MIETYTVEFGGKKHTVTFQGYGLERSRTSIWSVDVDCHRELITRDSKEAIRYVSDLFDLTEATPNNALPTAMRSYANAPND